MSAKQPSDIRRTSCARPVFSMSEVRARNEAQKADGFYNKQ